MGYVEQRPQNEFLREPKKLIEQICDQTPCMQRKSTYYLKRYCSTSVLLQKWELLEVTMRCPKPCSTVYLSTKIDLIRLTLYHWQPCVSKLCDLRKGWLCKTSCRIIIRNAMFNLFLFLREILQIVNFSQNKQRGILLSLQKIYKVILFWGHEISKRRVANGTKSNGLNLFLRIGAVAEQETSNTFLLSPVVLISSIKLISSSISIILI